jgi:NAD-dependent DNA ligase
LSAVARRAKAEGVIRRLANADRRNTLRYSAGLMKTSRAQVDGDGPLLGETVVFTGKLQIARDAAASQASIAGADVADNVTKKTTILVVGDQYLRLTRGQQKSSKQRKVETMIAEGATIRIVGESDFILMVAT